MRSFLVALTALSASVFACSAGDDGTATEDDNEIIDAQSFLERNLDPTTPPETPVIGRKTSEALAELTSGATSVGNAPSREGCTLERFKNATTGVVVGDHQVCQRSQVIRLLDKDEHPKTTYSDLNGDGKIDRFTGEDGAFISFVDTNFDGKVDVTVERLDRVKNFSLKGYPPGYKASQFIHRIREDRDKDGMLDHERIVAKAPLPPPG